MVKSHLIGLFERWPKKNNIIKTHMVEGGLLVASQFMANKYTVHSSLQGGAVSGEILCHVVVPIVRFELNHYSGYTGK